MAGEKTQQTIEDDLLSNIDFGDDDDFGSDPTGEGDEGNVQGAPAGDSRQGEAGAAATEKGGQSDGKGTQQGAQGDVGAGTPQQPAAQQGQTPEGLSPYSIDPRLRQDAKGNLVDQAGKVVFNAGRERRLYEDKIRLTRASESATKQIEQLTNELAQVRVLEGVPQSLGLSSEEARIGLQLAAGFKTKPLETLKYIIAQAKARGYNIEEAGRGTDINAIKQVLETHLRPITTQQQQSAAEAKAREDAQKELDQFYGRYTNASLHEDTLAVMLEQDPNATLETAYLRLANYALTQGLSMDEPLRPQLERKIAQQQGGVMNGGTGGQQAPVSGQGVKPMLNGSAGVDGAGGSSQQPPGAEVYDDPSTNWADIVRAAVRDAHRRS